MAHIMTVKELFRYLKLHEIIICKYAAEGQIPAIRIGRGAWRFDKDVIDDWIRTGQNETKTDGRSERKGDKKESGKKSQGNEKYRLIWVMLRQRYGKRLCPDWGLIIMTTR